MTALFAAALAAAVASGNQPLPSPTPSSIPMTVTAILDRSAGAVATCGHLQPNLAAAPRASLHTRINLAVGETWSTWVNGPGGFGLELTPTLPEPGKLSLKTRALEGSVTIAEATLAVRLGESATVSSSGNGACTTITVVARDEAPPMASAARSFVFHPSPGHDPEHIAAAVERQLRGDGDSDRLSATVNPVTGSVMVTGEPGLLSEARQLMESLDRTE
jgi:hypothetical protein